MRLPPEEEIKALIRQVIKEEAEEIEKLKDASKLEHEFLQVGRSFIGELSALDAGRVAKRALRRYREESRRV